MNAWVYTHLAADGSLLYVGKTHQREYRQRQHAAAASWWPQVASVEHFGPFTEADALATEAYLIAALDPPNNIMGGSRQAAMYRRRSESRRLNAMARTALWTLHKQVPSERAVRAWVADYRATLLAEPASADAGAA
jgi:excinuclease UvrABC nuclease subunit